jgi:aminoglycoside 2'-N-acetyltransferase I
MSDGGVSVRQSVGVPDVRVIAAADAPPSVLVEIRGLLELAFDGDFSGDDWAHTLGGWHVVLAAEDVIVSHAAVVPRVLDVGGRRYHAGYVEGVATHPSRQRGGFGATVMVAVAAVLQRSFDMGALSTGSHAFYERLGWERWRGPTFVRHGSDAIRTADEDGGVMVLRFGPSADIDLHAPISCEARPGDDW